MFERFTERARRVVVLAQEEARTYAHDHVGTEHLLLGLIREEQGAAARALAAAGVGLDATRDRLTEVVGRRTQAPAAHIPFSPRAKKVLELSLREALQLGHTYIGTEHILLGLLREGSGMAAQFVVAAGADLGQVRGLVIDAIRQQPPARPSSSGPAASRPAEAEKAPSLAVVSAQLRAVESRLSAVERRVGFGPDLSDVEQEIIRVFGAKHAAADAQDYEEAAVLRDRERELFAAKAAREQAWAAANPDLMSLAETVRRLGDEVQLLRQELAGPAAGSAAAAGAAQDPGKPASTLSPAPASAATASATTGQAGRKRGGKPAGKNAGKRASRSRSS